MQQETTEKKEYFIKQINVIDIVERMWAKRGFYTLVCFLSTVFGIIIAFLTPKKFSASVVLAPELSSEGLAGSISSLASLAGIDLNEGSDNEAIHLSIYPTVVASTPFIEEVLATNVETSDHDTLSFESYLMTRQRMALWELPGYYLKRHVLSKFISEVKAPGGEESEREYVYLPRKRFLLMENMQKILSCDIDKENGLISIGITTQDPLVCAQIANEAQKILQRYIIEYRTKKASNDIAYYAQLKEKAGQEYLEAQNNYAKYSDANKGPVLQIYKSNMENLENEMQLKYNTYAQVSSQLDMAKAKFQEKMPSFVLVQPSIVPIKADSPKKILAAVIWMVLGFIGASLKVFGKDIVESLRDKPAAA